MAEQDNLNLQLRSKLDEQNNGQGLRMNLMAALGATDRGQEEEKQQNSVAA